MSQNNSGTYVPEPPPRTIKNSGLEFPVNGQYDRATRYWSSTKDAATKVYPPSDPYNWYQEFCTPDGKVQYIEQNPLLFERDVPIRQKRFVPLSDDQAIVISCFDKTRGRITARADIGGWDENLAVLQRKQALALISFGVKGEVKDDEWLEKESQNRPIRWYSPSMNPQLRQIQAKQAQIIAAASNAGPPSQSAITTQSEGQASASGI